MIIIIISIVVIITIVIIIIITFINKSNNTNGITKIMIIITNVINTVPVRTACINMSKGIPNLEENLAVQIVEMKLPFLRRGCLDFLKTSTQTIFKK